MAQPNAAQMKKDAQAIFTKYQTGIARRLKKDEAVAMLMTEFKLTNQEADLMFEVFDKDHNELLSLWEFQQFYDTVGHRAHDTIELFKKLEDSGTGKVDIGRTFDEMQSLQLPDGAKLTDEQIERLIMTTAGESKEIDFNKFLNMMCRVFVHQGR